MRRLAAPALLAVGLIEAWLAHRTALPGGIIDRRWALFGEVMGMWMAAAAGLALVAALPRRTAVVLVLALAAAIRVASISAKAPLSDDLYRYAWDGAVQASGTDPYRYPPQAEQLRGLREAWLWPPERAQRARQTLINRPNVPTIYPPVAQAWFWLEHQVVPFTARDRGYEAVGLALDLAVLAVLLALLRAAGRDPRWVALYALSPVAVLESVQNAHVDTLGVLLVLTGVALGRRTGPSTAAWQSAALAAAALVKVYPGLLLPLLLRERGTRGRVAAVAVALGGLAYLPHVLAVGFRVVGYLPGYLREEQYGAGTRYLLVGLTGLRGAPASVVVVASLGALMVWLLRSDLPLPEAGVRLLTGLFLLVTPVQPWYGLLLVALATLCGWWPALVVAAAGYPLFFAVILHGPAVAVGRLSYGVAALAVLGAAVWRRRVPAPLAQGASGG